MNVGPLLILPLVLTSWSGANAAQLHISVSGIDAGAGSASYPWKTLGYACSQAKAGDTIQMGPGRFPESGTRKLPPGVSLIGRGRSGSDRSILTGTWSNTAEPVDHGSRGFVLVSEDGRDQSISGFVLEGNGRTLNGGLFLRGGQSIEVHDIDILDFRFMGAWIQGSTGINAHDMFIKDSGYEDEANCNGNLCFSGLIDSRIHHVKVSAWGPKSGYGIKAMGNPTHLKRLVISDCHIDIRPEASWAGGKAPNISIELWNTQPEACEIRDNTVNQHISLVTLNPVPGPSIRLHHNRININKGYAVELATGFVEADNNFITGAYGGFMEWGDAPRVSNVSIHHNVLEVAKVAVQFTAPAEAIRVYNNTMVFRGEDPTNPAPWLPSAVMFKYGGKGGDRDWSLYNNIIGFPRDSVGKVFSASQGGGPGGSSFRFNSIDNMEITPGWNSFGNLDGVPGLRKSGAKPFPFYQPSGPWSPVVDAGSRDGVGKAEWTGANPDMGAYEFSQGSSGDTLWKPLFNGNDLQGWDGNPAIWRVQSGYISGDGPADYIQGLTYKTAGFRDFTLKVSVMLVGGFGNSGIHYRSRYANTVKPWNIAGYQADVGKDWWGTLFEWKGGPGEPDNSGRQILATPSPQCVEAVKPGDWNAYEITAYGNRLTQKINGILCVDFRDTDTAKRADSGYISLQYHTPGGFPQRPGGGFEVRFKDILIHVPDQTSSVRRLAGSRAARSGGFAGRGPAFSGFNALGIKNSRKDKGGANENLE